MRIQTLGQEDPWRKKWHPTPVFLPGEFHGQRSLTGYSPCDRREWDTTDYWACTCRRDTRSKSTQWRCSDEVGAEQFVASSVKEAIQKSWCRIWTALEILDGTLVRASLEFRFLTGRSRQSDRWCLALQHGLSLLQLGCKWVRKGVHHEELSRKRRNQPAVLLMTPVLVDRPDTEKSPEITINHLHW